MRRQRVLTLVDRSYLILKVTFFFRRLSIIGGRILCWLLFPFPCLIVLSVPIKLLTFIVCFLGGLIGYFLNRIVSIFFLKLHIINKLLVIFVSFIWFMPLFSTILLNKIVLIIGGSFNKVCDYGWNEYFGGKIMVYLKNSSLIFRNYKYYVIIRIVLVLVCLIIRF